MHTTCTLHVHHMYTTCTLHVHHMYTTCTLHGHYLSDYERVHRIALALKIRSGRVERAHQNANGAYDVGGEQGSHEEDKDPKDYYYLLLTTRL